MPAFSTNFPLDYFAFARQLAPTGASGGKLTGKDTEQTPVYFTRHKDGTAIEVEPDIQSEREGGDGQEEGLRYRSLLKADGTLNVNARPQVAAHLFAGALGNLATTVNADGATIPTGCQKLVFTPAATQPYYTFEQRFADTIERSTNSKIGTLEIDGEAGRPLTLSAQFMSAGTAYQRDIASALTPARETDSPIFYPRASAVIYQGSAGNQIASGALLTKIKVSIKRGLDDGVQTTDLWRDDLVELAQDYDIDGTLKYVDRTLYQQVHYGGGSQIPVALSTGSIDLFFANGLSGTQARSMRLLFPMGQFVGAKVNKLDPDGKTVYLDFVYSTVKNYASGAAPMQAEVVVPSGAATAYLG